MNTSDQSRETSPVRFFRENMVLLFISIFLLVTGVFWIYVGDRARIAIPDNLDLFIPQYRMLNDTGTWFTHGSSMPFLGGVTRDDLPGEFNVTSMLYMVLPPLAAYLTNRYLGILISILGFILLGNLLGERGLLPRAGAAQRGLAALAGFAYGILPLFPNFQLAFASLPLLVWELFAFTGEETSDGKESGRILAGKILLGTLLFFYPAVSYFSYFGLLILGYLFLAWLILTLVKRSFQKRLLIALVLLTAGYVVFEYRLFASMLLGGEVTIRDSMVIGDLTLQQVVEMIRDAFLTGATMHSQTLHKMLVMPVVLAYFVLSWILALAGRKKMAGEKRSADASRGLVTWILVLILFNCLIYGLYYCGPFRRTLEFLVPPLKGWQFNRTVFFNGFLWYGAFGIALIRLCAFLAAHTQASVLEDIPVYIGAVAVLIILGTSGTYNDLYNSAHGEASRLLLGRNEDSLTYGEFYSEPLFEKIRTDLDYQGEWCLAYGFYPAILENSGFATLDGYLGFYSQNYKDAFRRIIAPALETNEGSRNYFDNWGARCYVYSGVSPTVVEPVRNYPHAAEPIAIDAGAMKDLGGKYVISRIEITNAADMDLLLRGTYTDEASPYVVYVYENIR